MSETEIREVYKQALDQWGIERQTFMVVEECGELLNALAKFRRNRATIAEIITELADVSIMCEQLAVFYGEQAFVKERERKLTRLRDKLYML